MNTRIKSFRFETGNIAKTEQSDYFRDLVGSFYNIYIDEESGPGFESDESVWIVGDRTVFSARQAPYFKSRPSLSWDRAPDRITISFCMTARGHTMSGDETATWNPGDVPIDFTSSPLVWQSFGPTLETSIVLPSEDAGFDPRKHDRLVVYPFRSAVARSVRLHASLIVDALQQGDHEPVPLLLDGFSMMIRTLFSDKHPEPMHAGVRELKRRAILRYIDTCLLDENLSVQKLCVDFGMSRPALYRLFEAYGGVADHIRNRKLDLAYARILGLPDAQSNISAIASELGFYDHAHLSHRFKERFGLSPRSLLSIHDQVRSSALGNPNRATLEKSTPDFIELVTAGKV